MTKSLRNLNKKLTFFSWDSVQVENYAKNYLKFMKKRKALGKE